MLHENLKGKLLENFDKNFSDFMHTCNTVLRKQFPKKRNDIRGNQLHFMSQTLSKVIMLRAKLRSKFLKSRTDEDKLCETTEPCVSLPRKTKIEYYSNLHEKNVCENKTFCEVVKQGYLRKLSQMKK